jgi:hypothetical protein
LTEVAPSTGEGPTDTAAGSMGSGCAVLMQSWTVGGKSEMTNL